MAHDNGILDRLVDNLLARGGRGKERLRVMLGDSVLNLLRTQTGDPDIQTRWEVLPSKDFWRVVGDYARKNKVSEREAFRALFSKMPDPKRVPPHPLLRVVKHG